MGGGERKRGIGVRISAENHAALQAAANARGVTLTWHLLEELGLGPVEGKDGRQRTAYANDTKPRTSRESQRLPVQFTSEERERLQKRAAAAHQSLSAYVHVKLGIEPRERGRPGHR